MWAWESHWPLSIPCLNKKGKWQWLQCTDYCFLTFVCPAADSWCRGKLWRDLAVTFAHLRRGHWDERSRLCTGVHSTMARDSRYVGTREVQGRHRESSSPQEQARGRAGCTEMLGRLCYWMFSKSWLSSVEVIPSCQSHYWIYSGTASAETGELIINKNSLWLGSVLSFRVAMEVLMPLRST